MDDLSNWAIALNCEVVTVIGRLEDLRLACLFQLILPNVAYDADHRGPGRLGGIADVGGDLAAQRLAVSKVCVNEALIDDHDRRFGVDVVLVKVPTPQQRCAECLPVVWRYGPAFHHRIRFAISPNESERERLVVTERRGIRCSRVLDA